HNGHVEDIVISGTAIAQTFLYPGLCDLPGSDFSFLLAVTSFFTGSGKLFFQWELYNWQWECLHAQLEDPNKLFQKLLEDLQIISKELAEYINSPSWDRPIFFNDNEDHYVQYKEYLENPSNEIAVLNFNQEKEKPLQDFDIRQLIREECCIKDCREQKKNTEDTMLELVEVCRQKEFYCMHDNVDDLIESALNSKLLSINLDSQCLDKKKQEVKNIIEQPTERRTQHNAYFEDIVVSGTAIAQTFLYPGLVFWQQWDIVDPFLDLSTRTRHAPNRMCLYIDAEEHELGDLDEPANYKATLLDPESDKWLNVMNVEMQSMKDNERGVTQTPRIDYEETFSPVPDIRAIRVFIAIAAYYDYEICAYIKKILKRYYMENSKRGSIPMEEKLKLSKSQGASTPAELNRMQNVPYASAVGSIMYDVRCTRPDVTFAQIVTSRFQQNPGDLHWTTIKNILKYLRNTKDMFLVYEGDLKRELMVSCYTDAGYLMDADDLKSQTGYVFVLNGGVVDWKSVKQSIFATSSAEAGYIAAFDASKEAVWVRKFIFGLDVVSTIEELISMYYDNTGAITIANESRITKGARHFRAKVHYLHEVIEYGDVKLEKVHTYDNLADPFTKALAFPKHSEHTRNIGMLPVSSLM
nr:hypothetical protein [Tanacetum cinerariifolium]